MAMLFENRGAKILKPLMADNAVVLTVQQQAIIGKWIMKTSLLMVIRDRVAAGAEYEFERQILRALNNRDDLPGGVSVRIGRTDPFDSDTSDPIAELSKMIPNGPPPVIHIFSVSATAWLVTELTVSEDLLTRNFIAGTQYCDRLVRVWPPTNPEVHFPPPHIVTRADMAALRTEYLRISGGLVIRNLWQPGILPGGIGIEIHD